MSILAITIQIVIALGILNVWLLRYGKPSSWRGGTAQNMPEEFRAYGLPTWFMKTVGSLKVFFATLLILGLWLPGITTTAALCIAVLMLGAVVMHVKIRDPLKKSLPALSLLLLCLIVAVQ